MRHNIFSRLQSFLVPSVLSLSICFSCEGWWPYYTYGKAQVQIILLAHAAKSCAYVCHLLRFSDKMQSLESFVILVAFWSITMILPDLKYLHTLKQTSGRLLVCFVGLCALSGNHPFCTYVGKGEQEVKVMYTFKYRSKDLFLMCICRYIFFWQSLQNSSPSILYPNKDQKMFIDIS